MALVLYEPLPILQHFHSQERSFNFSGINKQIKISQDWNAHGVAAVVWEAAVVLSTFLQNISKDIQGKNILELGSGTGLCGIIASLMGANVTFTDKLDELNICHENVQANLIQGFHKFTVKPLDWKNFDKKIWETMKFDFIIGADLVYIEELFPYLSNVFKFFGRQNNQLQIYLAGKIRYADRFNRFKNVIKNDFLIENVNYSTESDIYIMKLTAK